MSKRVVMVLFIAAVGIILLAAGYISEKHRFDPDLTPDTSGNGSEFPVDFHTNYFGLAALSPLIGDNRPSVVPLKMITLENGKAGLVDLDGKVVLKTNYDWIGNFYDGLAIVGIVGEEDSGSGVKDKWGFIDKTGKVVIPLKYGLAFSFSEGLAPFRAEGGLFGYLNTNGKVALKANYEDVEEFSDGVAQVQLNKSWIFINAKGEKVDRDGKVEKF